MIVSTEIPFKIQRAEEFISNYKPAKYIITNLIQSGYITTLTAQVGHGKTALLSYMSFCVSLGLSFGPYEVKKGNVLYIAGENEIDVCNRLAAQADHLGLDKLPENLYLMTLKYSNQLLDLKNEILNYLKENVIPIPSLIIFDTAASFFNGTDEINNIEQLKYAKAIRDFCKNFSDETAVIIACHPNKTARTSSELVPRGGSAFLAEIDCNMSLILKDKTIVLEAGEKFRGKRFGKLSFEILEIPCTRIFDYEKRPIDSVAVQFISLDKDTKILSVTKKSKDDEFIQNIIILALKKLGLVTISKIINEVKSSIEIIIDPTKFPIIIKEQLHLLRDKKIVEVIGKKYQLKT